MEYRKNFNFLYPPTPLLPSLQKKAENVVDVITLEVHSKYY